MDEAKKFSLAVFSSDQGPGDAERASIMSQAGAFLARHNARIVCLSSNGNLCVPLITSARSVGGEVTIIAGSDFEAPSALSGVPMERFPTHPEMHQRVNELADAFVGLPGSLASVTCLFDVWATSDGSIPVALLNKNRAFEVMRGFVGDIVSSKVSDIENHLQFADNMEDLWNRLSRMLNR